MQSNSDRGTGDSVSPAQFVLCTLTALLVIAGFATFAAWFALLLEEPWWHRAAPAARAVSICGVCGVVDAVREIGPLPRPALQGSSEEGAVILLAALVGATKAGAHPARIYETSVIHDDGSVRVLRDTGAPQWKSGDRVKVIKGRVEPVPLPPAMAALAASPAGRTPIPDPPARPAW